MKCSKCPYYSEGCMSNECRLVGWENSRTLEDCRLVNDDGTVNQEELSKNCY